MTYFTRYRQVHTSWHMSDRYEQPVISLGGRTVHPMLKTFISFSILDSSSSCAVKSTERGVF